MMCRYDLNIPKVRLVNDGKHYRACDSSAPHFSMQFFIPSLAPAGPQVADRLQAAVDKALDDGYRTKDIWTEGKKLAKCSEVGEILVKNVSA